jgi:ribosomal protein S18 acetylase RimI-like enzyme
LLDALIRQAIRSGVDRLSPSVEDGNDAVHLYRARGFKVVAREGDSDTMLLRLVGATEDFGV